MTEAPKLPPRQLMTCDRASTLFLPEGLKENAKNPAIIIEHPMGVVKEQSANLYATKWLKEAL